MGNDRPLTQALVDLLPDAATLRSLEVTIGKPSARRNGEDYPISSANR
jgi:hypothetical protein